MFEKNEYALFRDERPVIIVDAKEKIYIEPNDPENDKKYDFSVLIYIGDREDGGPGTSLTNELYIEFYTYVHEKPPKEIKLSGMMDRGDLNERDVIKNIRKSLKDNLKKKVKGVE